MFQQMRFCVLWGLHFCVYCGCWCEYELDLTMSQTPISNKTARQWQSVFSDKNCFSLTQSKEKFVHGFSRSHRRLPIFTFTFIRWWERLSFIQIKTNHHERHPDLITFRRQTTPGNEQHLIWQLCQNNIPVTFEYIRIMRSMLLIHKRLDTADFFTSACIKTTLRCLQCVHPEFCTLKISSCTSNNGSWNRADHVRIGANKCWTATFIRLLHWRKEKNVYFEAMHRLVELQKWKTAEDWWLCLHYEHFVSQKYNLFINQNTV